MILLESTKILWLASFVFSLVAAEAAMAQPEADTAAAIMAIKAVNGSFHESKKLPGQPVTEVGLKFESAIDIARLAPHLGKLTRLKSIALTLKEDINPKTPRLDLREGQWGFLDSLDELENLSLANLTLPRSAVKRIAALKNLSSLQLSNVLLTDDAFAEMLNSNLEILRIGGRGRDAKPSQLTDKSLVIIGSMKKLKLLDVSHQPGFTSQGFKSLANHPSLEELSYVGTQVDDSAVDTLKTIKTLKKVATTSDEMSVAGGRALRLSNQNAALKVFEVFPSKRNPAVGGLEPPRNEFELEGLDFAINLPAGWGAIAKTDEIQILPESPKKLNTLWIRASRSKSPMKSDKFARDWSQIFTGPDDKPLGDRVRVDKQSNEKYHLTLIRAKGNWGKNKTPYYNIAAVIDADKEQQWSFIFTGESAATEPNEAILLGLVEQFGFKVR